MSHTYKQSSAGASTATLSMINIDCADPARLAEFYATAFGWEVTFSDATYGMVEGDGVKIGFGMVEGFQPAKWPDESATKRFHLDLQVDDLDSASKWLCGLGASEPAFQPGVDRWRVLLDPEGQPFCLSPRHASSS
jgi:predicted enzyme related to lactoylglutathione lyase